MAGDRLRVEAPVGGVGVLPGAGGAHREPGHRRRRPVVGEALDDGESGSATCARDEGVAVAPVRGVGQLAQAVGARGHVRGGEGASRRAGVPVGHGSADREPGATDRRDVDDSDVLDHGQRRRLLDEPALELVQVGRRSLDLDHHPAGVVGDRPGQHQLARDRVHERPEPDPLDDAAHDQPPAAAHARRPDALTTGLGRHHRPFGEGTVIGSRSFVARRARASSELLSAGAYVSGRP